MNVCLMRKAQRKQFVTPTGICKKFVYRYYQRDDMLMYVCER